MKKGLFCPIEAELTDNKWIEEFLYPEKSLEASGRKPLTLDYIHEELAKFNVTVSLLQLKSALNIPSNSQNLSPDVRPSDNSVLRY